MLLKNKIKIEQDQIGQRIDKFLASFYAEKSRASWQKKIKSKEILINNKPIKSDYILKKGEEVKILFASQSSLTSPSLEKETIEIPKIEIIFEDDDVIVINKPAGVLSQPASSSNSPAVSDFLLKHFPKISEVGENEQRFGIVHRLDKDTSGVMIVAKNNHSFSFLKDQFKNRKTRKTYTALVYGIVKPKEGTINLAIGRSKTNPLMQTVIDSKKKESLKSRDATTSYETIETFDNYSLLKVSPKTGRMHQIRVHLKSLGFPIVGDKKYFFKKNRNIKPKLDRQFLHANKLKITIPSRKKDVFISQLPKDLKSFIIQVNHLD